MAKNISFTIKFWRQNGPKDQGHFDTHEMHDIPDDTSFLEMLDILNEELINEGKEPFVFDHDCRETVRLTARPSVALPPVSSICAASTTATSSPSSLGAQQLSP